MSEQDTAAIDSVPQEAPQAAPEGTTETAQPDVLSQLNDRLSRFESGFEQRFDQLAQSMQPQEDPYQQDPYAQQYEQPEPYGGLDPNDPRDAALIQSQQQLQQIQQAQERTSQDLWQRDLQALTDRYDDLNKPEVAGPVVEQAKALVQQMGGDPNGIIPIPLLENLYKAHKADEYAKSQQAVDAQQSVSLEQGGAMQQTAPDVDPADELLGPRPQAQSDFPWAVR